MVNDGDSFETKGEEPAKFRSSSRKELKKGMAVDSEQLTFEKGRTNRLRNETKGRTQ